MKTSLHLIILSVIVFALYHSCKKEQIVSKRHLTEVLYLDSYWKMKLNYDTNDRLISTHANATDTLFYNSQGQLIKYSNETATYAFEYNNIGQIRKRIPIATIFRNYHPDTIEYHYDVKGRILKTVSTFNDGYNIPRQGWVRTYTYNDKNDIIEYNGNHSYYNQKERETLSHDNGQNPLNLANSILFFLNEHFYEALNQHNPKRKDNNDYISIYSYNYSSDKTPTLQTIKFYSASGFSEPLSYKFARQVRFTYQ